MAYQLILSTDTLDQGRIKINDFFVNAGVGLFTASTGSYSIISSQNSNYTAGLRGFVVGYSNSGLTGDYSSIVGGRYNYTKANFNFVGTGQYNRIKTNTSAYASILNGKFNYIATTTNSRYSSILGGRSNNIQGGTYNTIINGQTNTIYGNNNIIAGGTIQVRKVSSNPSRNLVIGNNIVLSGDQNVRDNIVIGLDHVVNNTRGGVSDFSNYLSIVGGQIKNYKGGNSLMHGIKLSNETGPSSGVFKTDLLMFGRGSGGSYLRPLNSYSMVLGRNATRTVRIEFSSPSSVNLVGPGSFNQSGADYGEYFEWEDGNINNEHRVGYFVNISNGKIKLSNSTETIGIISDTTAFIGDSNEDYWNNIFLKDEWGNVIKEKYEEYVFEINNEKKTVFFDENGVSSENIPNPEISEKTFINGLIKENGTFIKERFELMINPNYDSNNKYIPRSERKEWDVVGLLGKLRVRTSEQITGNYVDVDVNTGMAKNGTKYPIMSKIKDYDGNYGIVLIFFK
jgi:hypothetical protein